MKTNRTFVSLKAALALPFLSLVSHAALVLNWSFDQTVYSASSTQSIFVTATLVNSPASDEHLLTSGAGASFGGDLQKLYDFTFTFGTAFVGLDLAPGEILHFNWGTLTPIGGFVPAGTYQSDPAFINFNGALVNPDNSFEVIVQPGGQPPLSGVPEPATLPFVGVLMAGVLGAAFRKRKNGTSPSEASAA